MFIITGFIRYCLFSFAGMLWLWRWRVVSLVVIVAVIFLLVLNRFALRGCWLQILHVNVSGPSCIAVYDNQRYYLAHLEGAAIFPRTWRVEHGGFIFYRRGSILSCIFSLVYPLPDFQFPGAVMEIVVFRLVLEGAREMDLHEFEGLFEVLAGGIGWRRWDIRGDTSSVR